MHTRVVPAFGFLHEETLLHGPSVDEAIKQHKYVVSWVHVTASTVIPVAISVFWGKNFSLKENFEEF